MQVRDNPLFDRQGLFSLSTLWFYENASDILTHLRNDDKNAYVFGGGKDQWIGFAHTAIRKEAEDLWIDIESFYICQPFRRQGIGKQCLGLRAQHTPDKRRRRRRRTDKEKRRETRSRKGGGRREEENMRNSPASRFAK